MAKKQNRRPREKKNELAKIRELIEENDKLKNEINQLKSSTNELSDRESLVHQVEQLKKDLSETRRRFYHHAFLAVKLGLQKNFSVPDLVEQACKENVQEEELNSWISVKLSLNTTTGDRSVERL